MNDDSWFGDGTELVLNTGDRVLVALARDDCPVGSLHDMTDRLRGRFPGVEFTILAGVTALAVQHATQNPPGDVQSPR